MDRESRDNDHASPLSVGFSSLLIYNSQVSIKRERDFKTFYWLKSEDVLTNGNCTN